MQQIKGNIGQEEIDNIRFEITKLEMQEDPDKERLKELKKRLKDLTK